MTSKVIVLAFLCSCLLSVKTEKFYKYEPSLSYCQKFEIEALLKDEKCVYKWRSTSSDLLCKFRCGPKGEIKIFDCRKNADKVEEPLCSDLICLAIEEVNITNNLCEFLAEWDQNYLCSYECDEFGDLLLIACEELFSSPDVPRCTDLYCPRKESGEEKSGNSTSEG